MKKTLPEQWMITDSSKIDPIAAAEKLPRNSGIILRDYDLSFAARLELGIKLKRICLRRKIILLVAHNAKLAFKLNADGIHLPEFAKAEIHRWRAKKPNWIITASAHSPRAANFAVNNGADAVLISPVFETLSHPKTTSLGITRAKAYIYNVNRHIAAYALGGVKAKHLKALKMAGFKGFAGISWVKN